MNVERFEKVCKLAVNRFLPCEFISNAYKRVLDEEGEDTADLSLYYPISIAHTPDEYVGQFSVVKNVFVVGRKIYDQVIDYIDGDGLTYGDLIRELKKKAEHDSNCDHLEFVKSKTGLHPEGYYYSPQSGKTILYTLI